MRRIIRLAGPRVVKRRVLLALFGLCLVLGFSALGRWQLGREGSKRLQLAEAAAALAAPAQALGPAMIAQRWGKVINISSQTGVIALDDHAAYATSKGALNALTKSLCAEWARHNVQVNAICPTVILTPMGKAVWGPEEKGGPMRAATPARR